MSLERVRARHHHEGMIAALIYCGPDLGGVLGSIDHLFVSHVPAAFGPLLIFEDHAARPHAQKLADHVLHVERTAVPGVGIDDDADIDRARDAARDVENLTLREKTEIRLPEIRRRDRVTR